MKSLVRSSLETPIWRNRVEEIIRSRLEPDKTIIALSYLNNCKPQLQNGPQCGLVAIQMGLSALQNVEVPAIDALFQQAKDLGYTLNGEMFSVKNVASLCQRQTNCAAEVFQVCNSSVIVTKLLEGNPILIPYDNDKNFHPCLKNGSSAHWAVIIGVLLLTTDVIDTSELSKDEEIDVLFHTNTLSKVATAVSPDCLYVYALHGKSRHVALWNLDQLIKSNQNLMELGEERMNDGRSYLLPEGGVRAGLNGLAIALQKIQQ